MYARLRASFLSSLTVLLLAAPTLAQAPADAQRYLESRHAELQQLMRRPSGDARDQRLAEMLGQLLDYDALAQRALSRHWGDRTPAERAEFVDLLRQLVERSYRSNLESTLNYEVRYVGAEAQGSDVLVKTMARSRTNRRQPAVAIDYSMHRNGDRWRVFDVWTDGVSLVENYRSQFNRIIRREGWDALLNRMRDRVAAGAADL